MFVLTKKVAVFSLLASAPLLVLAQGFSFRPMDGADAASAPIAPGWRVDPMPPSQHQAASQSQPGNFQFFPQVQQQAAPAPAEGRPANAMHYSFAPEEQAAAPKPPAPLPEPMKTPDTLAAPPVMGFAAPSHPMQARDGFGMQGQQPHPSGIPPAPLPPPLRLEGRYIDGPHSPVDQRFPFRPLDEGHRSADRSGASQADTQRYRDYGQPGVDQSRQPAFGYPPPVPAYGSRPYERYNSGPSFNGIRFPFNFR